MNPLLNIKFFNCISPQSANAGAFASNTAVNTAGLLDLIFLMKTGSLGAAVGSTDSSTAPKIEECDTEGGSYSDVTDAELSGVIADTDDNKMFAIRVDLRKSHKKFMRVNAPTAGSGACLLDIVAIGIPAVGPQSATDMGLEELITA